MAQHSNVDLGAVSYTRADFTALRAWVLRVPLERIAQLYYSDEAPQVKRGLERFLVEMRQDLIERATVANPRLAENLAKARSGGAITAGILDVLVKAANAQPSVPKPSDPIAQWLRPGVARAVMHTGVSTLASLVAHIERFGPAWWRPIPRLGQKRAAAIVRWLSKTPELAVRAETQIAVLDAQNLSPLGADPLPVERIATLPHPLDGHDGRNRASTFCFIQARNDLEAVRAYLVKFRHQPNTLRAYQRELERLLLWCVIERKTALSSMLVHDCEAYKDFLAAPSLAFCGPRDKRLSPRWRPFSGPLSLASQHQAIQIIRTAFAWLQDVRYLGGNPWTAVSNPRREQQLQPIQIGRALPSSLWEKTVEALARFASKPEATQIRIGRAALLMLGDSGLRISELASAQVTQLRASVDANLQLLEVLGKGAKWRTVPVSPRAHEALKDHWADLFITSPQALINPISRPQTNASQKKDTHGYAARALARVIQQTLEKVSHDPVFSVDEQVKLRLMTAHGFRHTFGVRAVRTMRINTVRAILGHESIDTTSIYAREEEREIAADAEVFFGQGK